MIRALILFAFILLINAASGGPIASLRLDKGVVVRSEIMYADDYFYYCRKVTNPDETFRVSVDKVPQSLRRRIKYLVEKGELTKPPSDQEAAAVKPKSELGNWRFRDVNRDDLVVRSIALRGRSNSSVRPELFFRFYKKEYSAFLSFDRKVVSIIKWQVTYQVDDEPKVTEIWRSSESGTSAFSQGPFFLRDQLKGARLLRISAIDYRQQPVELLFDLNGFDEAIALLEEGLGLPEE
ncbi:MAG: hypothetical protein ACSHYA_09855 [Opitutaceae bacterium]